MPYFRLWPAKYPITVETSSPEAFVYGEDIERLDVVGCSWANREWHGSAITEFRRQLEERLLVAKERGEVSSDDPSIPLASILESVLGVVREAERVSDAYYLWYVGAY